MRRTLSSILNPPSSEIAQIVFAVLKPQTTLDYKAWTISCGDVEISEGDHKKIDAMVKRWHNGEPIEYIVGSILFDGLKLAVNHDVLIPRPETAELIELIKKHLTEVSHPLTLVDVGTGSGVIAISLKKWANLNKINLKIIVTDISPKALDIAKSNSAQLIQSSQIDFRCGNLLDPITEPVDIIVANLPYIPSKDLEKLDLSVTKYEPLLALDGGKDGYFLIDKLLEQTKQKLTPNGVIFLEIYDEHNIDHFKKFTDFETKILPDSFGRTRFAVLRKIS
ncbi:MAG: peptide chain release factor N(5)-glutamine methyltransferase [Patescibacteria group bacterium]|jgi:release factor glutamine methyltransferase